MTHVSMCKKLDKILLRLFLGLNTQNMYSWDNDHPLWGTMLFFHNKIPELNFKFNTRKRINDWNNLITNICLIL